MSYFIFDINKCTGCNACMIACSIENGTEAGFNFREVNNFNELKLPGIPVFHISSACNHCEDAPCIKNCPSTALHRDSVTNAVVVNHDKCMGCQYCVWSCPYDVPKFNHSLKMVEKCNWCNHKIEKKLKPNCSNLCPTGALDFSFSNKDIESKSITAFPDTKTRPNIEFIYYKYKTPENQNVNLNNEEKKEVSVILKNELPKKIHAKQEWGLVLFTLTVSLLTATMGAKAFFNFNFNITIYISLLFFAGIVSIVHLGKKVRSWRSITNIKSSWLSREIACFAFFGALSMLSFLFPETKALIIAGTIFGLLTLISIEMIYIKVAKSIIPFYLHSDNTILTSIFFISVISEMFYFILIILITKLVLYLVKFIQKYKPDKNTLFVTLAVRILFLIIIPLIIFNVNPQHQEIFIAGSFLLSELIGRTEFYNDLIIKTPKHKIYKDLSEIILK